MKTGQIETIFRAQRASLESGTLAPVKKRLELLKQLKQCIEDNEREIMEALHEDLCKCTTEAYTSEIGILYKEIDYVASHLKRWARRRAVRTGLMNMPGKSYVSPRARGIVLIIGPWNYPFNLVFSPLIYALSAGNTAVIKPSEYATHSAQLLCNIISRSFDESLCACILGDAGTGQMLIDHSPDFVFFTGGLRGGKAVYETAARRVIPVALELGGKNPCIIDSGCNLEVAARRVTWGKFFNAGQTCVAPDFCIVHSQAYDAFISQCRETVRDFYGTDPSESQSYGRIINRRHFDRLVRLLDGQECIQGGRFDRDELYIEPTLVEVSSFDTPVMKEEIFGPLLPVMRYTTVDELLGMLQNTRHPLMLMIFSANRKLRQAVVSRSVSGNVCINGTLHRMMSVRLPFGGTGKSGFGRYHGEEGFKLFSQLQSVMTKSTLFDVKSIYPPYTLSLSAVKRAFKYFL